MKLDPLEARLIEQLRQLPTVKVTVVKHKGKIVSINSEINAAVVDKAHGRGGLWEKPAPIKVQTVPRGTNGAVDLHTPRDGG